MSIIDDTVNSLAAARRRGQTIAAAGAPLQDADAAYTGWVNAAGLPGLALPAAPAREGLPIGLQLIGPYGGDDLLLDLGTAFETAAPWADRWPPL